jgi:hypothetical protein
MKTMLMLVSVPTVTSSVNKIIFGQKLITLSRSASPIDVRNRPDPIRLDPVEQRCKDPPGFGQFIGSNEVHLRSNENVKDQTFVCVRQSGISVPVIKVMKNLKSSFLKTRDKGPFKY